MCYQRILFCVSAVAFVFGSCSSNDARAKINKPLSHVKSFPYLYAEVGNPSASYPVLDHLAISDRSDFDESNYQDDFDDRPDFLFSDTGTYRIVEFYVHW
jgi:hypothetical protein